MTWQNLPMSNRFKNLIYILHFLKFLSSIWQKRNTLILAFLIICPSMLATLSTVHVKLIKSRYSRLWESFWIAKRVIQKYSYSKIKPTIILNSRKILCSKAGYLGGCLEVENEYCSWSPKVNFFEINKDFFTMVDHLSFMILIIKQTFTNLILLAEANEK